jgi:hypothetical protein
MVTSRSSAEAEAARHLGAHIEERMKSLNRR